MHAVWVSVGSFSTSQRTQLWPQLLWVDRDCKQHARGVRSSPRFRIRTAHLRQPALYAELRAHVFRLSADVHVDAYVRKRPRPAPLRLGICMASECDESSFAEREEEERFGCRMDRREPERSAGVRSRSRSTPSPLDARVCRLCAAWKYVRRARRSSATRVATGTIRVNRTGEAEQHAHAARTAAQR